MVRLTDRPDMTLDVYRGREKTTQQQQQPYKVYNTVSPRRLVARVFPAGHTTLNQYRDQTWFFMH